MERTQKRLCGDYDFNNSVSLLYSVINKRTEAYKQHFSCLQNELEKKLLSEEIAQEQKRVEEAKEKLLRIEEELNLQEVNGCGHDTTKNVSISEHASYNPGEQKDYVVSETKEPGQDNASWSKDPAQKSGLCKSIKFPRY